MDLSIVPPETSTIEQVIGKKYLRKKTILGEKERESLYVVEECNTDEYAGCKFVLLLFSAGWCPPCEQFLQVLKDFYSEVNRVDKKVIEVFYVSQDKSEEEFKKTYAKMPWITVPFSNPTHN